VKSTRITAACQRKENILWLLGERRVRIQSYDKSSFIAGTPEPPEFS
jgi:hypothetical protein